MMIGKVGGSIQEGPGLANERRAPAEVAPEGRKPPAAERIADELRALILEGALGAEARLPGEQELAQRFGVSRPTLREALKRLAAQNLIRTKRGATGGSFVSAVSHEDARAEIAGTLTRLVGMAPVPARDVAEARLALLTACAPLAAARRTAAQIRAMRSEVEIQRAEATGDGEFCASDVRFYRVFAEATGNPLLALQTAGVVDAIQPLLNRLTYRSHDRAARALRHARIAARLERRDVAGLAAELAEASTETERLVAEAQALRAQRWAGG